jgi:hypothetical protein
MAAAPRNPEAKISCSEHLFVVACEQVFVEKGPDMAIAIPLERELTRRQGVPSRPTLRVVDSTPVVRVGTSVEVRRAARARMLRRRRRALATVVVTGALVLLALPGTPSAVRAAWVSQPTPLNVAVGRRHNLRRPVG